MLWTCWSVLEFWLKTVKSLKKMRTIRKLSLAIKEWMPILSNPKLKMPSMLWKRNKYTSEDYNKNSKIWRNSLVEIEEITPKNSLIFLFWLSNQVKSEGQKLTFKCNRISRNSALIRTTKWKFLAI